MKKDNPDPKIILPIIELIYESGYIDQTLSIMELKIKTNKKVTLDEGKHLMYIIDKYRRGILRLPN